MPEQPATTTTLRISEVKNRLSSLVDAVYRRETRILVEKAGIPVAAIVSARDLERLVQLDEQRERRRQAVEAMREPFRGVPPEEIEQATATAFAEVRAEQRVEREAAAAR